MMNFRATGKSSSHTLASTQDDPPSKLPNSTTGNFSGNEEFPGFASAGNVEQSGNVFQSETIFVASVSVF